MKDAVDFIYLIHPFQSKRRLDISHSDNSSNCEASWVGIQCRNYKNFLIAVVYRHPRKRGDSKFIDYLRGIIYNRPRKEEKTVVIIGNLNI